MTAADVSCRMMGGPSEVMEASEYVQELCNEVKASVEGGNNQKYDVFVAKSYTSQVVSGTNYFIKVHVGGDVHIDIVVHEALQCHGGLVSLLGFPEPKPQLIGFPEPKPQLIGFPEPKTELLGFPESETQMPD
ncbi:hypothetical protein NHX12_021837 [Muraenolepis orangiensis]|uniref:Cystatin-B n=1 Tax=Muraenolepis orangiensis TaxID=630683 RepID=A0A9Q0ER41_9TELE|nr:hypothetical protein NHX12_021837 [Muraenolepis orangiensis]